MSHSVIPNATIHPVQEAIAKLRALTQVCVQNGWRYFAQDLPEETASNSEQWHDWLTTELNTKNYIVWSAGKQVIWLKQSFVIPHNLQGYPLTGLSLRLALTWWAEDAKIFVNGKLIQQGDLFDSSARILLSSTVITGEEITVALRLVSPGHDIGALMRSQCIYDTMDELDPGFFADEIAVLYQYIEAFEPEKLSLLTTAISRIDWTGVSTPSAFRKSLNTVRQNLQLLIKQNQLTSPKQRQIQMLGHAHLDLAWLWTLSETWQVAQRTFESVLKLQQEFPELTFCHSTPALYSWIEANCPDLFAAIKQQIKANRWEIVGGMWVEPEVNLVSGESLVRQVLYAQRYTLEKFGKLTTVAWLPDSFGFCWQLPQILKQGGIEFFVTQKLHWNDTTKFPHGIFWWKSPDGTKILSLMSPPNTTGVMDTNPITMASYTVDWETKTKLKVAFWLPGVGDHGGGPTRDMLEVTRRWQKSPFFPQLEFTTAQNYLLEISNSCSPNNQQQELADLPIWDDELYLEFHRGCYTTHADQKYWNRRCENLLYEAELWATLANLTTNLAYPKSQLEFAWKKALFNQFHDILPGTSIPEVFVEANLVWQEVENLSLKILHQSQQAIASHIHLPQPPQSDAQAIIVFNSLNWQRSEVVSLSLPSTISTSPWQIYDLSGEKLPSQLTQESTLLFLAEDIPSVGYRLFWLCHCHQQPNDQIIPFTSIPREDWVLENEILQVVINPTTGDLSRVFDKINQREVLSGAGNQLQSFQDQGQYWDAWNIDPNYAQNPLPPTQLKSIQWLETGVLYSSIRVIRQLGQSQFCQDYILQINSSVLQISTTVDWQESHVLVKAAFPFNLEASHATYEIACGTIKRPTKPQTPAYKAKWEVPALRWADLGDDNYGVSLLNDCKYGYDAQPSELRLTLLRSPCWPDASADRGIHHFTYALYPHGGNWQSAETVRRGYELNLPLQVLSDLPLSSAQASLKPAGQFLDLQAQNLVLMALKPSEDNLEQYLLRCYECYGEEAEFAIKSDLDLAIAYPIDILERPTKQQVKILPWKIANFMLTNSCQKQSPL
jgi:alpha-mannosidase